MLPVLQLPGEGQGPDVHSPYEYILRILINLTVYR